MKWTCEECKKEFEYESNSEESRVSELHRNFGNQWNAADCVKLCDDCYKLFMERFNAAQS